MSEFTTKVFNGFVAQGKLMGNRCKSCGDIHIPPRQICAKCGSQQLEWFEFKGEGTLEAVTLNKVPSSGFRDLAPYAVGIVRLDEGPSISGLMDVKKPEALKIGERMRFIPIKDREKTILGFRLL
jgi:uncharacterized OB-fold protein